MKGILLITILCVLALTTFTSVGDARRTDRQTAPETLACWSESALESASQRQAPRTALATSKWKCGESGPLTVAFVGNKIYWTDYSAGTVVKAPLGGGSATVIASDQGGPCSITADGSNVYWTNSSEGTVMKMSINDGHPVVLARDQRQPSAIGLSQSYIAWMTIEGPRMSDIKTGDAVKMASDDSNAGGGTNPGTVKCHVCPIYCTRYVPQIPNGYWETYICGWQSCPPCGA